MNKSYFTNTQAVQLIIYEKLILLKIWTVEHPAVLLLHFKHNIYKERGFPI